MIEAAAEATDDRDRIGAAVEAGENSQLRVGFDLVGRGELNGDAFGPNAREPRLTERIAVADDQVRDEAERPCADGSAIGRHDEVDSVPPARPGDVHERAVRDDTVGNHEGSHGVGCYAARTARIRLNSFALTVRPIGIGEGAVLDSRPCPTP